MIVWGGSNGSVLPDGGRYDPLTDLWTPTALVGNPGARNRHTAIWNGSEMVVWGGTSSLAFDSGGRYDPLTDSWTPTSLLAAPTPRWGHGAVWTGSFMVVWGGSGNLDDGGRYAFGQSTDDDGDGLSECQGDCNDTLAFIYPAAPQLCDGWNNDCDDLSWPTVPSDEYDQDLDGIRICEGDCDDTNPHSSPGAPEINDGFDNQCPGDPGYGLVDEITGPINFFIPGNRDELSWTAQGGTTDYEVARAELRNFTATCVAGTTPAPVWIDAQLPPSGVAFHYLVRPLAPFAGSWGTDSSGVERVLTCP